MNYIFKSCQFPKYYFLLIFWKFLKAIFICNKEGKYLVVRHLQTILGNPSQTFRYAAQHSETFGSGVTENASDIRAIYINKTTCTLVLI